MDVRDFVRVGKVWIPLALVLAILVAAASYLFTKRAVRPIYSASVTMQVQLGGPSQPTSPDPAFDQLFAATEAQVASQSPNVDAAVQKVQAAVSKQFGQEDWLQVRQSVSCASSPTTALFSCRASAHNPVIAAQVANTLASVFINRESAWDQSRYQTVLNRVVKQERAAQAARDAARYSNLVQLETSTRLAAAQRATIVRVVSPAQTPLSPSSPHPTLNAALSFFAAFLLVLGIGYVLNMLDDSVRDEEVLKEFTGLPILGHIPSIPGLRNQQVSAESIMLVKQPRSSAAEAFRVVRASIDLSRVDHPPRSLLVTSPLQGDGKSTFASNLGYAFAEAGKTVILVDMDLRRPSLSATVDSPVRGLTNLLVDPEGQVGSYLVTGPLPTLYVLPSGPLPPSPAQFISSERMRIIMTQLAGMADIVIVDSPPVLVAADATVAASYCDSGVMVIKAGDIKRKPLKRAVETLEASGVRILGLVVNGVPRGNSGYYGYGYYTSGKQSNAARKGKAS